MPKTSNMTSRAVSRPGESDAPTWPPRLMRCALGNTSFSSFANCTRRLLGSREVVMRTFGSRSAACAYSSSICVRGT